MRPGKSATLRKYVAELTSFVQLIAWLHKASLEGRCEDTVSSNSLSKGGRQKNVSAGSLLLLLKLWSHEISASPSFPDSTNLPLQQPLRKLGPKMPRKWT